MTQKLTERDVVSKLATAYQEVQQLKGYYHHKSAFIRKELSEITSDLEFLAIAGEAINEELTKYYTREPNSNQHNFTAYNLLWLVNKISSEYRVELARLNKCEENFDRAKSEDLNENLTESNAERSDHDN